MMTIRSNLLAFFFVLLPVLSFFWSGRCKPLSRLSQLFASPATVQSLQEAGNQCTVQTTQAQAQSRAPFTEALRSIAPPILEGSKEQFFFPGHGGGKHLPADFTTLSSPTSTSSPWQFDVPELDGLDNIHSPEGPLLEALQLAAELFGAKRTWFLVNGSTSGILVAIFSCIRVWCSTVGFARKEEDKEVEKVKPLVFLVSRDCHKSVFDALALSGRCDAVLLPCDVDDTFQVPIGVRSAAVQEAITQYDGRICGLVLTRPSYQGVLAHGSAVANMVDLCHKHRIPVIIDEAHGSHLRFLPESQSKDDLNAGANTSQSTTSTPGRFADGIACGADLVVQSSHKTLTALSQCAMLHLGPLAFQCVLPGSSSNENVVDKNDSSSDISIYSRSSSVDADNGADPNDSYTQTDAIDTVQSYFSALTTTSPNALLLASLDSTRAQFATSGAAMVGAAAEAAAELKQAIRDRSGAGVRASVEAGLGAATGAGARARSGTGEAAVVAVATGPAIVLLEDSAQMRGLDLVVDPLRLSVHYHPAHSSSASASASLSSSDHDHISTQASSCTPPENMTEGEGEEGGKEDWAARRALLRTSIDMDDLLCDQWGLFCELNLPDCVTFAVPPGATRESLRPLWKGLLSILPTREEQKEQAEEEIEARSRGGLVSGTVHGEDLGNAAVAYGDAYQAGAIRAYSSSADKREADTQADTQGGARQTDRDDADEHARQVGERAEKVQAFGSVSGSGSGTGDVASELGYARLADRMGARTEAVAIAIDNVKGSNSLLLGRVSAETLSVYPPGIPLLVRGEVLRAGHVQLLARLQTAVAAQEQGWASALLGSGCTVTGASDASLRTIRLYRQVQLK